LAHCDSMPTTEPDTPTNVAASIETSPAPQPRSRTRMPRSIPALRSRRSVVAWTIEACLTGAGSRPANVREHRSCHPCNLLRVHDSPFGPARAARNKWDPIGAGRPRHLHLIGDALIEATRGFGLEQLGRAIFMLARAAGDRRGIGLVEDAHVQKPQRQAREGDADAVTAALYGAPLQRRGHRHACEPRHGIVVDDEDLSELRALRRTFA